MAQAVPFLTFQPTRGAGAADAFELWFDLFDDGRVLNQTLRGAGDPGGAEGTVLFAEFTLAGQTFRCSDSGVEHDWTFSPSISISVDCDDADSQQRIFTGLAHGGEVFMPLDDYGFGPFGWVQDRFGVSWQLGLRSGQVPVAKKPSSTGR